MVKLGIIGGSGLENLELLQDKKEYELKTPYGKPSSRLVGGKLNGIDIIFLSRHGKKHTINPTNVNYRANIWALKEKGCTHILSVTACGSLKKSIDPGTFVIVDQFIDRTTKRICTFYDTDKVCHIPMAAPFCPNMGKILAATAKYLKLKHVLGGTIITIEGPRFSSMSESRIYKNVFGADVINMTTVPEVVLAREAGMCYAAVAMCTDYDCWNEKEVNIEEVIKIMKDNTEKVKKLLAGVALFYKSFNNNGCKCREYIKTAIIGD